MFDVHLNNKFLKIIYGVLYVTIYGVWGKKSRKEN